MLTYQITYINHLYDNLPKELDLSTSEFLNFLRPRPSPKKNKVKLWSPARFTSPYRQAQFVDYVSMLVYDVDSGLEVPEHNETLWDYEYFIFHSYSSTPEKHKWRLIIPLKHPIPGKVYPRIWDQIKEVFNWKINGIPGKINPIKCDLDVTSHLDSKCKDSNRAFYVPSYPIGSKPMKPIIHLGKRFDFQYKIPPPPPPKPRIYPKIVHWSHNDTNGELKHGLRTNPQWRIAQGQQLGCVQNGNRMVGFQCPDCGRSDATYFYIDGVGTYCGHHNSCTPYAGSLYELSKYHGVL